MNNEDFRNLVLGSSSSQHLNNGTSNTKTPGVPLGSSTKSGITMMPRSLRGKNKRSSFTQKSGTEQGSYQPSKKFKSHAVKGTKLAAGYRDRTAERNQSNPEQDEKEQRVQALEEEMKLGKIDKEAFEKLRNQIAGGDISSTHLVKGLDWKLLERVRAGEDVFGKKAKSGEEGGEKSTDEDQALEELEKAEVTPIIRETVEKKGEFALPRVVAGTKRSRKEILAEMKAQRKAEEEAKAKRLLKPIGEKESERYGSGRIYIDEQGREVLITTDKDGNMKRKIRKIDPKLSKNASNVKLEGKDEEVPATVPDSEVADVPASASNQTSAEVFREHSQQEDSQEEKKEDVDSDSDIFEGVGRDYDPLAGLEADEETSSSSSEDGHSSNEDVESSEETEEQEPPEVSTPSEIPPTTNSKRDYFKSRPVTGPLPT